MSYAVAYVYGRNNIKKRVKSGSSTGGGKLRDLYAVLFRSKGIMPDTVAKQNPKRLLDLLDSLAEEKQEEYTGIPEELKFFYGM